MSIADKLTYLQTTKQLLKTEINKINNVLDDNSTFRSYPQELFNGYLDILNNGTDTLWNNLEKVSASGEEATLENVETAPMKMVLNGNTSQDTTTGRNKLPTNKSDWESGHYDTSGNKSAFATRMRTIDLIPFLPNTTYSVLGTDFYIREYDSNGTFINNSGSVYNGGTFTTNSNTAYLGISINITYSDYVENINQIAIFLNSETNKTWEPYTGGQPSPSPDYPQEVKVVTGENVVSVSGKNLFDKDNANIRLGRRMGLNGISIVDNDYFISDYIEIKPSTQYSVNYTMSVYTRIAYYDKDKIFISDNSSLATFTTPSNAKYLILGNLQTELNNVQIEKGSTATPYVPYSKTDYEVNLGKNLADISLGFRNGYLNTDTGVFVSENQSYVLNQYIEVKGGTAYTYSLNNTITNMSIWSFDENKNFIKREKIVYSKSASTITTDSNAKYVVLGGNYNNSTTITQEILESLDIQLELGSTATSYSSYFTPIELCKINTYKDYFHKDSGKWYVHKEIGKVVLNGSENWNTYQGTGVIIFRTIVASAKSSKSGYLFSNYFKQSNILQSYGLIRNQPQNYYNLEFTIENITEVADFKTWLSTHNTIVYYVLATPTEEEITNTTLIEQLEAISKAKSVKDKTYITQTNDDLPFILDVEAIKEYEVN